MGEFEPKTSEKPRSKTAMIIGINAVRSALECGRPVEKSAIADARSDARNLIDAAQSSDSDMTDECVESLHDFLGETSDKPASSRIDDPTVGIRSGQLLATPFES